MPLVEGALLTGKCLIHVASIKLQSAECMVHRGYLLSALCSMLFAFEEAKDKFDRLTDGKKRSLIYSINRMKDIDKQVQTSLKFLNEGGIRVHK